MFVELEQAPEVTPTRLSEADRRLRTTLEPARTNLRKSLGVRRLSVRPPFARTDTEAKQSLVVCWPVTQSRLTQWVTIRQTRSAPCPPENVGLILPPRIPPASTCIPATEAAGDLAHPAINAPRPRFRRLVCNLKYVIPRYVTPVFSDGLFCPCFPSLFQADKPDPRTASIAG